MGLGNSAIYNEGLMSITLFKPKIIQFKNWSEMGYETVNNIILMKPSPIGPVH